MSCPLAASALPAALSEQACETDVALWSPSRQLTYADLFRALRGRSEQIARVAPPGSLLCLKPGRGMDDAVDFLACLEVGVVPLVVDPAWPPAMAREVQTRLGAGRIERDLIEVGHTRVAAPVAFCRFTSGSSGAPTPLAFTGEAGLAAADNWGAAAKYQRSSRILAVAPISNGLAFNACLLSGLRAGATVALYEGPLLPTALARWGREFQPQCVAAFPTVYNFLVRNVDRLASNFSEVKLWLSAGAPLEMQVKEALSAATGGGVGDYYGLAETGPVTFNDGRDLNGQGRVLPRAELRVLGDDGVEQPVGLSGRVAVRTASMALGRLAEAPVGLQPLPLTAGFYLTADRAIVSAGGDLTLQGRLDDVVLLGAEKIDLRAIEAEILTFEGVADVAVCLEATGSTPFLSAFVQGEGLTPLRIRELCAARLSWSRAPAEVVIVQAIPRSATGKVLKDQLRLTLKEPQRA